jgi:iron uptake system EfeUOB component EfeO/EfeM
MPRSGFAEMWILEKDDVLSEVGGSKVTLRSDVYSHTEIRVQSR